MLALFTTPLTSRLARRMGAVDVPGPLSIHSTPTPRLGGLAVSLGLYGGLLLASWATVEGAGQLSIYTGIVVGGLIVLATGLVEDSRGLPRSLRVVGALLGASITIAAGVQVGLFPWPSVGLLVTFFFLVGGANAMNLLDGMDGLASGVTALAAAFLLLLALLAPGPQVEAGAIAVLLAGASVGFLWHNRPRARAFLGDGGSLLLGFTLASIVCLLASQPGDWRGLVSPLLVLALPIADTAAALARRLRRWRFFIGDRSHLYDLLLRRGWSPSRVLAAMYGVTILGGLAGLLVRLA